MDGFAVVCGPDVGPGTRLPVVGRSLAGRPYAGRLAAQQCVQIMTGAVVSEGANAVVPVEQTNGFGAAEVVLAAEVKPGQNIRPLGSECAAGTVVRRRAPAWLGEGGSA